MTHRRSCWISLVLPIVPFALAAVAACGGPTLSSAASTSDASTSDDSGKSDVGTSDASSVSLRDDGGTTGDASSGDGAVSLLSLPIGDGKYQGFPQVGYVFSCQTTISGGGGASIDGPWIHAEAGTFDFTAKVAVEGSVSWPSHSFAATLSGATRTVTGNALPDHATGTFPIASTDPAYAYDRNPNSIAAQTLSWALPAIPTVATTPTCIGGGPIGVMTTGALLFDALDGEGRDALAHETQDSCQAHPDQSSEYHYHSLTQCISDPGTGHSALLGYARDGFRIYGVRGENGETLTDADLDECHGHTHAIQWDGATVTLYHYHATYEYPYTLGCFRGTPVAQ